MFVKDERPIKPFYERDVAKRLQGDDVTVLVQGLIERWQRKKSTYALFRLDQLSLGSNLSRNRVLEVTIAHGP